MTTHDSISVLRKHIMPSDLLVSSLGRTAEEVFNQIENPDRVLFLDCLGATIGVAVGVSLGSPNNRVFALETDGSFMYDMTIFHSVANLSHRLKELVIMVFDNECLESGGGLKSRAVPFNWEKYAASWGLHLLVINDVCQLDALLSDPNIVKPLILVLKIDNTGIDQTCHKNVDGIESKYRFKRFINDNINSNIIQPCVKN